MPAKRKATPTKKKTNTAGQRYTYTSLNNVSVSSGSDDQHHVYGVIVDATFPYKVSKDRFICSMKIVDNTLNGKDFANVVIFGKRFEDLPIVQRVGDIIRLHRAGLRVYEDRRQFNVNTHLWSSWACFSTDSAAAGGAATRANEPTSHNGKAFTFEKHEVNVLSHLRGWAKSYFGGHDAVQVNKGAISKQGKGDFDVVAKIVQCHNFDEYTNELKLVDSAGECWFTLATKLKFPHLRSGDVVKIRSVMVDSTAEKRVLTQSHYSNIMTFINGAKMSKSGSGFKASAKNPAGNAAAMITAPASKFAGMRTSSLDEIAGSKDSTHRICVQVLAVQPGSVQEMVKCFNAGKTSSAKGSKDKLVWHVQMLCKDASTANGDKQYKILNYSEGGFGSSFFGPAKDLHNDAGARKRVEGQVAEMTKFNNWCDMIVERVGSNFVVRDTSFAK